MLLTYLLGFYLQFENQIIERLTDIENKIVEPRLPVDLVDLVDLVLVYDNDNTTSGYF